MMYTIQSQALADFKARWPCHGLPDNLDAITFTFAPNGGDLRFYGRNRTVTCCGIVIEPSGDDPQLDPTGQRPPATL
jgi:hypothetical protein